MSPLSLGIMMENPGLPSFICRHAALPVLDVCRLRLPGEPARPTPWPQGNGPWFGTKSQPQSSLLMLPPWSQLRHCPACQGAVVAWCAGYCWSIINANKRMGQKKQQIAFAYSSQLFSSGLTLLWWLRAAMKVHSATSPPLSKCDNYRQASSQGDQGGGSTGILPPIQ